MLSIDLRLPLEHMKDTMDICIASRNAHKLDEIRSILELPGLLSANDLPDIPEIEEDGDSFAANAVKKAVTLARITGMWALGDDSGLVVNALGGQPGIRSARFAGEHATDEENNRKLLRLLEGVDDRAAYFCCVLALSDPQGASRTVEGRCRGHVLRSPSGTTGFGYDPLFVPEGHSMSFAQMTPEQKNAISHRGNALGQAKQAWGDLFTA